MYGLARRRSSTAGVIPLAADLRDRNALVAALAGIHPDSSVLLHVAQAADRSGERRGERRNDREPVRRAARQTAAACGAGDGNQALPGAI